MSKMKYSFYNIENRAEKEYYSRPRAPGCGVYLLLNRHKIFWNYVITNIYKISLDDNSEFLITHRKLRTVLHEIRDYVSNMKQGAENFYMQTNLKMNPKLIALDNKPLFYF